MRTTAMLIGLLVAGWGAAAMAQTPPARDPLATRGGWEAGTSVAHYRYEEPGVMHLTGDRFGATGSYTESNEIGYYGRVEMRLSYAELDYQGSGALGHVPDWLFEMRMLAGRDFRAGKLGWAPYAGVGYRYLYNDLRGTSSTGALGYRRYSGYFYLPLGVTLRMRLGDAWVLSPQLEYDAFVRGTQRTYLADTGLGLNNVSNLQRRGRGYRAQLMLEGRRWAFGPWLHYWNVKDSDIQSAGMGASGLEPGNWTRESGVELRFRF